MEKNEGEGDREHKACVYLTHMVREEHTHRVASAQRSEARGAWPCGYLGKDPFNMTTVQRSCTRNVWGLIRSQASWSKANESERGRK